MQCYKTKLSMCLYLQITTWNSMFKCNKTYITLQTHNLTLTSSANHRPWTLVWALAWTVEWEVSHQLTSSECGKGKKRVLLCNSLLPCPLLCKVDLLRLKGTTIVSPLPNAKNLCDVKMPDEVSRTNYFADITR